MSVISGEEHTPPPPRVKAGEGMVGGRYAPGHDRCGEEYLHYKTTGTNNIKLPDHIRLHNYLRLRINQPQILISKT